MPQPSTGRKILVADDEPHVTFMLAMKLKRPHVSVIVANDGEEALALARQHRPDLVVTDFQMPRLSGYDMAVKLRETAELAETPVIMLTARGHRLSPADLIKTNIQHLVPKPFSVRDLLERISDFIDMGEADAAPKGLAA